jgi:hypothetical protein
MAAQIGKDGVGIVTCAAFFSASSLMLSMCSNGSRATCPAARQRLLGLTSQRVNILSISVQGMSLEQSVSLVQGMSSLCMEQAYRHGI